MKKKLAFLLIIIFALSIVRISASEQKHVPIILYHNVVDNYTPDKGQTLINISPTLFEQHIKRLKDDGYSAIDFNEYYAYLKGEYELPSKPIIITFDDGYISNYTNAYPILKKYNMKATIFIITSTVGDKDTLYPHFNWDQAREMESNGLISICSHSNTHRDMTKLSWSDVLVELRISKYLIEKELGKKCDVFAFPYGQFNADSIKFANDAGYKITCKVGDMGSNSSYEGANALKRLTLRGDQSPDDIIKWIEFSVKNFNG